MAKQRRCQRGPVSVYAPSFAGGRRHHVVRRVMPEPVRWPQQEFHPSHAQRVANTARAALGGPSRLHTAVEPAQPPSMREALQRVHARCPWLSCHQLAVAVASAASARPRPRSCVPERGAAVAAHSQLSPAAFAAEVPHHPDARWLAEVAEHGTDTGFTAGSRLRVLDNHASAYADFAVIDADIATALERGHAVRVTELYLADSSLGLIVAPQAVVRHPRTNKERVVTDCSFGVGTCANDSCDPTNLPRTRLCSPTDLGNAIVGMQESRPSDPVLLQNYDLKSAYKSTTIRAEDWWTVAFAWRGEVYWWVCNPFGHRTGGTALCAATSILTAHLARVAGINSKAYVDDLGTPLFSSQSAADDAAVKLTIDRFGLVHAVAKEEAGGPPANVKDWTGFTFSAAERQISIPTQKLRDLCSDLASALRSGRLDGRAAHSLWSRLLHVCRAIPALEPFIASLRGWLHSCAGGARSRKRVLLSGAVVEDLTLFLSLVDKHNGVCMLPATAVTPTATVSTDSCSTGYGGVVNGDRYAYGWWATDAGEPLAGWHINFKEAATALVLVRDAIAAGHRRIHIFCDNTSAVSAFSRMRSTSPDLLPVQRALAHLLVTHGVVCTCSYIPTLQNVLADGISRHDLSLLRRLFPGAALISLPPSWALQLRQSPLQWATL